MGEGSKRVTDELGQCLGKCQVAIERLKLSPLEGPSVAGERSNIVKKTMSSDLKKRRNSCV